MTKGASTAPSNEAEKRLRQARGLALSGRTRQNQLKTRIGVGIIGAGLLWLAGGPRLAIGWLVLMMASQLVDTIIWRGFRDPDRPRAPTRTEWVLLCANGVQAGLVYSMFAVLLWTSGRPEGEVFANLWLCGSLLHVTLHMHHERRTLIAGAAPHALYLFALPVYSYGFADGAGLMSLLVLIAGGVLYLSHLVLAFREFSGLSRDMRRAKEAAQERQAAAEQASAAKSAFLANMSHEIRTPMNGILGMADALNASELSEEQAEKIRIIRDSGDHLMAILNDLLDISKIEANKVDFEAAPFSLLDLAARTRRLHGLKAEEKGLAFEVDCRGDCGTLRIGDVHRVSQIIDNLVSNAMKFTDQGFVHVDIKAPPRGRAGDVLVTVADSGVGIAAATIDILFQPFTQADASTTRRYGGTGLGLAICRSLAVHMGGSIRVESQPGEGSAFIVRLPLAIADDARSVEMAPAPITEVAPLRVLVADDNDVNRAVMKAFLDRLGHDAVYVEDGRAAVEAYMSQAPFDLVLMDITMPEMDGVEALREIRRHERDRGAAPTPVIAFSAHAMQQHIESYMASGFDGYVTKPVRADSLKAEIARVMTARAAAA